MIVHKIGLTEEFPQVRLIEGMKEKLKIMKS